MAQSRYVGAGTNIFVGGRWLELVRFGQPVDISDDDLRICREHKVLLVGAGDWEQFHFTDDELRLYPTPQFATGAPQAFLDRRDRAVQLAHDGVLAATTPTLPIAAQAEGAGLPKISEIKILPNGTAATEEIHNA